MAMTTEMNAKYMVLENRQIYHEGDERSRTNPGHGYPAYTENVKTPVFAKDEDELKSILRSHMGYGRKMPLVFAITPVKISQEINVTIGDS